MNVSVAKIRTKYLEKIMLFYASLIFLGTAFEEATKNKHNSLDQALSQFREAMPESLKEVSSDKEPDYERYFYNLHFIELVSNIELFLVEIITLVVLRNPKKIGRQQITIADVIEFGDVARIVENACADYLNALTYKKPSDYKDVFLSLLSADANLVDEEWSKFIEMKARRDLGVHNDWRINETYKRKIKDVGLQPPEGIKYMYPNELYVHECVELAKTLYEKICNQVREKYS